MTLLLAHPEAEDLGRFVEGTLEDPERAAIVDHIADCDDCRMLIVHAAEFIEPGKTESHRWWQAAAAAVLAIGIGGGFFWNASSDPLRRERSVFAELHNRPVEARLSRFAYVPRTVNRGGGDDEADIPVLKLQGEAAQVLQREGNSTKIAHAKGVSQLLLAATAKEADNVDIPAERREAIAKLEAAVRSDPKNAGYENDLAVALLSTGDPKQRDLAIKHLDNALLIAPRLPEALFNRALALSGRNPKEAIAAYNRYLAVDSSSRWADEARRNIGNLQEAF